MDSVSTFQILPQASEIPHESINKLFFSANIFNLLSSELVCHEMVSLNHVNSFAYNKLSLFGQDDMRFLLLMDLFELMIPHYLHLCMEWLGPHEFAI